jgi:glycerophosphoryl diester phosphodiesterase
MIKILAHRGNVNGSNHSTENTVAVCEESVKLGFGLELDVRTYNEKLYAKHDPIESEKEQLWDEIVSVIKYYPELPIAINIKEADCECSLIKSISELDKCNIFLFDLELVVGLEKYDSLASLYRNLDPNLEVAIRVSDRKETLERAISSKSTVVWLDEFDKFWVSAESVHTLNQAGKTIYAVAPDLHGYSAQVSMNRCREFIEWGITGICTDYPIMLKNICKEMN